MKCSTDRITVKLRSFQPELPLKSDTEVRHGFDDNLSAHSPRDGRLVGVRMTFHETMASCLQPPGKIGDLKVPIN